MDCACDCGTLVALEAIGGIILWFIGSCIISIPIILIAEKLGILHIKE